MPRLDHLQRELERTLEHLTTMHEEGTLPPVLEPLLTLAPSRGARVAVHLREDGSEATIAFHAAGPARGAARNGREPMATLVEAQLEAERSPQLHFVALKLLRDRLLPETHQVWSRSPQTCQALVAEAIERGILLTSKKPNPRNPEYPVTAVRLNRDDPLVRKVAAELGVDPDGPEPEMEMESAG